MAKRRKPETDGDRVAAWLAHYCVHVKGEWARNHDPFVLEDWQRRFVAELFEVDASGRRVYSEALLGIPRKNGKSSLAAAIGHYLLSGDSEPGPEVISAAGSRDQARMVHDAARLMARRGKRLSKVVRVLRSEIHNDKNDGVWRVVAHDADLQQGTNPSGSVVDEYHVHKSDAMWNALAAGTGARQNPLLLGITTAGANIASPCGKLYEAALKMPDVERPTPFLTIARDKDAGFLMYWFGVDSDDVDIENPATMLGTNPASWVTPEFLTRQLGKPSMREVDFRRFHLNQWAADVDEGISAEAWDACQVDGITIPDGAPAYSASDLGFTSDWSAHVIAAEVDGRIVVQARGWPPPVGDGVETDIRATVDHHARSEAARLQMRGMLCDDWNARLMMQDWMNEGLPAAVWSMKPSFMCPASVSFLEAVNQGRVAHDGDPVLRQHVLSMRMRDTLGGWKFDKHPMNDDPGGEFKSDIGLCAVAAVSQIAQAGPNALEEFGLFI